MSFWLLVVALLVSSRLCSADPLPWEKPEPPENETLIREVLGDFDAEGRLHNSTERVYQFPDIGVWTGYFPSTDDLSAGLSVELHDRSHQRGFINWFKVDALVAEQRLGIAVGRKLVPIIDFTVSIYLTRDFDRDDWTCGLGLGITKF